MSNEDLVREAMGRFTDDDSNYAVAGRLRVSEGTVRKLRAWYRDQALPLGDFKSPTRDALIAFLREDAGENGRTAATLEQKAAAWDAVVSLVEAVRRGSARPAGPAETTGPAADEAVSQKAARSRQEGAREARRERRRRNTN